MGAKEYVTSVLFCSQYLCLLLPVPQKRIRMGRARAEKWKKAIGTACHGDPTHLC